MNLANVCTLTLIGTYASFAQKPIKVTFGEPSVWSLDQAHYLLEQRFQKNHTLEATRPTQEELNANAVHGNKLTAIRTLVQAGATFDQAVGTNNQLAQGRIAEDLSLRKSRLEALDQSFATQATLAAKIAEIANEPSNYAVKADGARGDMLPEPKAKTSALTLELEAEKRRGEHIKSALTDSVPTQLQKVDAPTPMNLGQLGFDMLKDKFAFSDPKLAASNAVDNFVNLQNEMIMKQVTLLRNEAGANRRIVFAELPQSIDVEGLRWYRKAAENKLVQVQWRLAGFLYEKRLTEQERRDKYENDRKKYQMQGNFAIRQYVDRDGKPQQVSQQDSTDTSDTEEDQGPYVRRDLISKTLETARGTEAEKNPDCAPWPRYVSAAHDKSPTHESRALQNVEYGTMYEDPCGRGELMPPGTLRAVELVPRQSSLNINERHYAHNAVNLFGLFRLLSGFGMNVGYQRQKEAYEQYITQEIYASSFGKGLNEFGWTFAANPGTRTVAPGQRNTYAIFSVPKNALSVVLRARACVFDRRDMLDESDCPSEWQQFVIPIPSENDSGFWVDEIRYSPVIAGTRQMVYMSGRHFSNLTGVLVNGVPLRRSVAVAAPELAGPWTAPNGDGGIVGEYELLGSEQLVMAFRMPASYTGTPNIALITPVKARYVNDLTLKHVRVGAKRYYRTQARLDHPDVFPMFYARPEIRSVRRDRNLLHVEGSGLSLNDDSASTVWVRYFWNDQLVRLVRPTGVPVSRDAVAERIVLNAAGVPTGERSDLRMEFDQELSVQPVRYVTADPRLFGVTKASILKFVPGEAADAKKKTPGVPASALLQVTGKNFVDGMSIEMEYNNGRCEVVFGRRTAEGDLIARISPPLKGGFAVFTVRAPGSTPASASGSVEIPAPAAPKEPDFEESERTIKQIPVKKKAT